MTNTTTGNTFKVYPMGRNSYSFLHAETGMELRRVRGKKKARILRTGLQGVQGTWQEMRAAAWAISL